MSSRCRLWTGLAAFVALFAMTATQGIAARCAMPGDVAGHPCCDSSADPAIAAAEACTDMLAGAPALDQAKPPEEESFRRAPSTQPLTVAATARLPERLPVRRAGAAPAHGSEVSLSIRHSVLRI